ncbi:uncharacterized protein METZ01_LOCUS360547, partial [marine metagenome]
MPPVYKAQFSGSRLNPVAPAWLPKGRSP